MSLSTAEMRSLLGGVNRRGRPVRALSGVSVLVGLWWLRKQLGAAASARAEDSRSSLIEYG